MLIECSNCEFKYLVNSADLKPKGRMVECANCRHQWYQKLSDLEILSLESISTEQNSEKSKSIEEKKEDKYKVVKNLPSTVVKKEKPSIVSSFIVVLMLIFIFLGIWIAKSLGTNALVIIDFYIREFFFNLNLIISDLSKIIYNILN